MNFEEFTKKFNLSLDVYNNLNSYVELLKKWQKSINLVSNNTINDVWQRHIIDSIQLVKCIPSNVKTICDLGSGGGFPGLVIAIACPHIQITLVDSDSRKCAFLKDVIRKLSLTNAVILTQRIETLQDKFDLITSRALAKLSILIELSLNIVHDNSIALFLKGRDYKSEIESLKAHDTFVINEIIPSITNKDSVIVKMSTCTKP